MPESQAELQAGLEEFLVKMFSKQMKISEEQARATLQPILARKDVLKEISSRLPEIQSMADTISKLPPEMRQPMFDLVVRNIVSREDDEDEDVAEITKTAKSIGKAMAVAKVVSKIVSEALKEEQDKKPQDIESLKADLIKTELEKIKTEIKSEVESLKKEIKRIKSKRRKNVLAKLAKSLSKLAEALEVHERRFEEIEKKIESMQQAPVVLPAQPQPAQPQAEPREGESKEDLKKKVRDLIRESTEFLEEFGFEVRKPGESKTGKEKSALDKLIDRLSEMLGDKEVIKTVAEMVKETFRELRQAQGQGPTTTTTRIPKLESYLGEVEESSAGGSAPEGGAVGGGEGPEGPGVAEGSAGGDSQ